MSTVLITGASRGIGRGIAVELIRRGHDVIATARDAASLDDLSGAAKRLALDVVDPVSVQNAVEGAGDVDVLVANAGVIFHSSVEEIPIDEMQRLFDVNTLGQLRIVQALLPGMRDRGHGRVLLQSSIGGRIVLPPSTAYAATKWALEAIGEGLSRELSPFGISVGLLEPGAVSSGALEDVTRFQSLPGDPYRIEPGEYPYITVEQAAAEMADAVEADTIPLRIPIGDPARTVLATV